MKINSKNVFAIVMSMGLISGCAEVDPLSEYTPVVDPGRTNMAKFERDVVACRNIALKVEADYKKRQDEQALQGLMVGLLIGAAAGSISGNRSGAQGNYTRSGAVIGAAAGATSADYTHDLVKFGPRRIVDRCMADRGHRLLNEIGRG